VPAFQVVNRMTGQVIASPVYYASSFFLRMRGLLGRSFLKDGEGLYLPKCNSIHTFFMQFSIDVVFIDKSLRVKKVVPHLKPFRLAWGSTGTFGTLEVAAETANKKNCVPGDQLEFVNI